MRMKMRIYMKIKMKIRIYMKLKMKLRVVLLFAKDSGG